MSQIQVITSEIRSAAHKLAQAANGVTDASPEKDLDGIPGAMPGSQSAGAAQALGSAWATQFKKWHDDAIAEHDVMVDNANNYDESDLRADQRALSAQRSYNVPVPTK